MCSVVILQNGSRCISLKKIAVTSEQKQRPEICYLVIYLSRLSFFHSFIHFSLACKDADCKWKQPGSVYCCLVACFPLKMSIQQFYGPSRVWRFSMALVQYNC